MLKTAVAPTQRIYSIDILRGIIMIIMALDHVRDFFHIGAFTDSPTNLATTTPLLFFTRWVTHFCAPGFVLLAGVSAYLMEQKKSKPEMSGFLIKRGLWLIIVELFIVTFAWTYNPFYNVFILQVIWVIGISMIILGIFVWMPSNAILISGLIIICFHNFLDYAEISRHGQVGILWNFAHHGSFTPVPIAKDHIAIIAYSFLPWTGIMMLGYGLGRLFTDGFSSVKRRKFLLLLGFAGILLFVVLRLANHYGDPVPWSVQRSNMYSFFSFINVNKYPPSLDYISMTIGVILILLGLLEGVSRTSFSFFRAFGRVPFFYYVLHLYLIHAIAVMIFFIQKFPAKDIAPQHSPFLFRPDNFGFGLAGVYMIWILVVVILYPLCKKYNRYKSTHKQWWLSYI